MRRRNVKSAVPHPVTALAALLGAGALALFGTTPGALPAAAAPAPSSQPGVTASTITVGQVDTLSGPVPGLFEGAKDGTQAYLDYINSKGGVDGRKLKLDVEDDQFSATNYANDTRALVQRDFALVGGFSLFDASGVPAINAAKIPDVTFSLSQARALDEYNYSPDPLVPGGSRLGPFQYYKSKYRGAITHIGTLYSNVATAEAQSVADINAMKSIGYKIAYSRIVNPVETDFIPDVLKMKAAGVKMIYIVGLAVTQVADLAKDMQQEDFHPLMFSTNGVAYDSSYATNAGTAANGTYSDLQTALYGGEDAKSVPAVGLFDKWVRKVNPNAHFDVYGVYGWAAAQLFVQALQAAGSQPTRTGLLQALNKITSFNAGGLIATGNPAQKVPQKCWLLVKYQNGKWQRVAPSPKTGFLCNPASYYYPPGYHPFHRTVP